MAARYGVLLLALSFPALLLACGGGGLDDDDDDISWRFTSNQTGGSGTGGTIIEVNNQGQVVAGAIPVRLALFEDVVLREIRWVEAPDLEGDGAPDTVSLEGSVVRLELSTGPRLAFGAASDAVEVRALDANGDALADLVVRRADGRVDLYLNQTGS